MGGRSFRREHTRTFAELVADRLQSIDTMMGDRLLSIENMVHALYSQRMKLSLDELYPTGKTGSNNLQADLDNNSAGTGGGDLVLNEAVAEFWKTRGFKALLSDDGNLLVKSVTTLDLDSVLPETESRSVVDHHVDDHVPIHLEKQDHVPVMQQEYEHPHQ